MTTHIEHKIVPVVGATSALQDNADSEIVSSEGDIECRDGNKSSHSESVALAMVVLAALAAMTSVELHQLWRCHYRFVPPKKISRDILELGVAWKIQENKHGGLGSVVARQIGELAKTLESKSDPARPRIRTPKPGARLLRSWNGVTHEVLVVEHGYHWAGKAWDSLSAIAHEITGTRWSGPRFFGLKTIAKSCVAEQKPEVLGSTSDHE